MLEVIGVLPEGVGAGDGESPAFRIYFMLFCGVALALPIGWLNPKALSWLDLSLIYAACF